MSVPAREVGGDFFNYFALSDGQIALLVGDVSGKGVGAALLMANIQASLRTRFALGQDLAAIAREIDVDIEANTPGPVYATLFMAIFDPADARAPLRQRRAQPAVHPAPQRRASSGCRRPGCRSACWRGAGYTETRVQLGVGDVLFFYTDGCVEAESESRRDVRRRASRERCSGRRRGADDLLARVEAAIRAFRGAREPFDDATMMVVRVG